MFFKSCKMYATDFQGDTLTFIKCYQQEYIACHSLKMQKKKKKNTKKNEDVK